MILSAIAFCKRATCPTTDALMAYRQSGLGTDGMVSVASHLDECDFCGAELQLLSEHPPADVEKCTLAVMPAHLRWLAESLLSGKVLNIETFAGTVFEKERLTLTDA